MENLNEYKVKNGKNTCYVYLYFDKCLWTRYRVRGTYKGGNIAEFLNERLLSGNVFSCHHYLDYIDKYIEDKQFLKGGINNEK